MIGAYTAAANDLSVLVVEKTRDEASPDLGSRGGARIGTSAEVLNVDGTRCWRLAKGYRTDGFPTDRE